MADAHLLFVYGSLLRGEVNHDRLQGAMFVGRDRLSGALLLDGGSYPFLVLGASTSVVGECYQLTSKHLQAIDAFEDHPHVYCRQRVVLASQSEAWTFVGQSPHINGLPEIAAADWPSYRSLR